MDRKLEKKPWFVKHRLAILSGVALLSVITYSLAMSSGGQKLRIDAERIGVSQVTYGEFKEFIPIIGIVEPEKTIYLDVVQGGRVEEIFVEDGQQIAKGELIVRLSNDSLVQSSINNESLFIENMSSLRERQFTLTTQQLNLREQLLDYNFQINQLEIDLERQEGISKHNKNLISQSQLEDNKNRLKYNKDKRDILIKRIDLEDELRETQLSQIQDSILQVDKNLDLIKQTLDSLNVRSPISGQLSTLRVELGRSILQGENIGKIDILDSFKVRAEIDQFYISKVSIGQFGEFRFDGKKHDIKISKIYPQVINDVFTVDFEFVGDSGVGIKPGQSVQINLSFGDEERVLLLSKGSYYRDTGGRWVYVLGDDGMSAYKREIRIGRQNSQNFELVEGLEVGDWIITSGYGSFNEAEKLILSKKVTEIN
uniref:Probable RND efflux membrane fusion protein n=1 Tax=Rheinheimera sp. BAL341 TaxID=1708203 RepID=A0A486XLN0_9GAMM